MENINKLSLEQQALLIINTLRCVNASDPLAQQAKKQLASIRQLAIEDEQNGLRWKDIADSEELSNSAGETVAALARLLSPQEKIRMLTPALLNGY